jgi:hypothetical protein
MPAQAPRHAGGADSREDGRAAGVLAGDGRFLQLLSSRPLIQDDIHAADGPGGLAPDFLMKIGNYRAAGTLARVNSHLPGFPDSDASRRMKPHCSRPYPSPDRRSTTSSARSITRSLRRDLGRALARGDNPSILDPDLAPPGAHVMSVYALRAVQTERRRLGFISRSALARVLATLEEFAPGIGPRAGRGGRDTRRPRINLRFLGRSHSPRRACAGSARDDETRARVWAIRKPCARAVSVRSGNASRRIWRPEEAKLAAREIAIAHLRRG